MTKALVYPGYFAHQLRYAHRSNYSGPRNRKALYLAVHTVQGSYSSCINWFQNPSANVSAHYVVSAGGHTTQMVGENMMAWHIGNHNIYTIGIEHEGYAHDGHPPTNAMYHASAKLAAGICRRHGIPVSRILGHRDFRGQSHTDPGNEWNMSKYRSLVKGYLNPKSGGGEKPPGLVHRVIAGSFRDRAGADERAARLKAAGFGAWVYPHDGWHRVQVAAFSEKSGAREVETRLKRKGFDAFIASENSGKA